MRRQHAPSAYSRRLLAAHSQVRLAVSAHDIRDIHQHRSPAALFAESAGNGQAAVTSESERRHLGAERILAAFPFGAVHEAHHGVDGPFVEAVGE